MCVRVCVSVFGLQSVTCHIFPRSPGEKMTEAEIDALMQGQEDENGKINYEGEPRFTMTILTPYA